MLQRSLKTFARRNWPTNLKMAHFCSDINELVAFVDTGVINIIERKDTSFMYYDKVYQKEMNKDSVMQRVLGQEPVAVQFVW